MICSRSYICNKGATDLAWELICQHTCYKRVTVPDRLIVMPMYNELSDSTAAGTCTSVRRYKCGFQEQSLH